MNDKALPPQHAVLRHLSAQNLSAQDQPFLWGGQTLEALALQAGQTPFYAYDSALVRASVAHLRATLPPSIHLHYAMKANPLPALVAMMAAWVDGIDVASGGELQTALAVGARAADISFAGPGKRPEELEQAVAAGILVNVESMREVRLLAEITQRLGLPARVAVRVNPDFDLKSAGMKMGGGAKPFGVDAEQVPLVLAEMGRLGLGFEGFQLFAGSQNLNAGLIAQAQRQSFELAVRLAAHAPGPVRVLNLGGGFGIPYFAGEEPLDLAPIGANLQQLAERAKTELPQAQLVLELGRFLVGEAGIYVARILDRKLSRGQVFLVADGGMHHHLAASGNFGQVIRKNYPVTLCRAAAKPPDSARPSDSARPADAATGQPRREIASVVGPLCSPLDLLADKMDLPVGQEGDWVIVFQSGAYGFTASPSAFLSQAKCTEIII